MNEIDLFSNCPAWSGEPGSNADNTRRCEGDIEDQEARIKCSRQVNKSDWRDENGCFCRITKGGKLDDLSLTPDSSPFIDSVTRADSFDADDNDQQPSIGLEGMEVVGRALEVATPMGTRWASNFNWPRLDQCIGQMSGLGSLVREFGAQEWGQPDLPGDKNLVSSEPITTCLNPSGPLSRIGSSPYWHRSKPNWKLETEEPPKLLVLYNFLLTLENKPQGEV